MVNRVFKCDPPVDWNGKRRLFLRGAAPASAVPDLYLIALDSDNIGRIDRRGSWICDHGTVLSFSDGNGKQQAIVLLPLTGGFKVRQERSTFIQQIGRPSEAVLAHR